MAGIYIPGMAMPTNADGCEVIIRIQPDGEVLDAGRIHLGIKAIPVPDHGRLGDLDALADQCDDPYWCVWLSDIDDAPTVIPADREE